MPPARAAARPPPQPPRLPGGGGNKNQNDDQATTTSPQQSAVADLIAHSLVETGVRGCLAAAAAYVLHVNPFAFASAAADGASWPSPAATAALALALAVPAIALDALVLGPDLPTSGKKNNTTTTTTAAVARARIHFARHTAPLAVGPTAAALPPTVRAALEAAGQLSEDALARGVLLAGLATWLHARAVEAGPLFRVVEEKIWHTGGGVVATAAAATASSSSSSIADDPAWWLAATLLLAGAASRIAGATTHARQQGQKRRDAREQELDARMRVLRYEPMAVQEREREEMEKRREAGGEAWAAANDGNAGGDFALAGEHAIVGTRFLLGQAACYGAYILSGGALWASFVSGIAAQAAHGALVGRRAARDEEELRRRREEEEAEAAAAARRLASVDEF